MSFRRECFSNGDRVMYFYIDDIKNHVYTTKFQLQKNCRLTNYEDIDRFFNSENLTDYVFAGLPLIDFGQKKGWLGFYDNVMYSWEAIEPFLRRFSDINPDDVLDTLKIFNWKTASPQHFWKQAELFELWDGNIKKGIVAFYGLDISEDDGETLAICAARGKTFRCPYECLKPINFEVEAIDVKPAKRAKLESNCNLPNGDLFIREGLYVVWENDRAIFRKMKIP